VAIEPTTIRYYTKSRKHVSTARPFVRSWPQFQAIDYRPHLAGLAAALTMLCGNQASLLCAAPPPLPPLTTGSPRLPGKFVWADLVTDNVPVAQRFYGKLFGWSFQIRGNYTVAANDERPLCGMFQRPRPKDQSAQPRWFAYISIRSVERAQKTVTKLGGRILAPPQKFPKRGEQAIFADPEGALFGVLKSSSGDPEDFQAEPGDWIWIELLSRDARKAGEFYRAVAGYDLVENTTSTRPDDYVFVSEGYARAAALTLSKDQLRVESTWLLFVRVKSITECIAQVGQLGGKILLPPNPQLLDGKLAVIADPAGAPVGVMEWSLELLKGGR
jgi:predicted enzyme related to lactoylglutathione lyase